MKNRRGMVVAAAFLAAAALAVGFFLPDLAGRAADQKLSVQAETFAIGKVPSAADARLVDMLKLADTYENELYLDHGAVSDESDIRISAADIINRLSEYGVLDKIECEDFSLSPFIAVKGKMLSFGFTRYGGIRGAEEGYQNEEEISKEIQEDLKQKSAGLQTFCEDYYGFRHTGTEYHTEGPSCFARIFFEDESGENITLDLERDQYGTVYTWNRTL